MRTIAFFGILTSLALLDIAMILGVAKDRVSVNNSDADSVLLFLIIFLLLFVAGILKGAACLFIDRRNNGGGNDDEDDDDFPDEPDPLPEPPFGNEVPEILRQYYEEKEERSRETALV